MTTSRRESRLGRRLRALTTLGACGWGLVLAALLEAITAALRFGTGLTSGESTSWLAPFTGGLRIHHGYPGLLLLALAPTIRRAAPRNALVILAVGLIVSDLAHHFLVLWPITGSPEFDLWYPDR